MLLIRVLFSFLLVLLFTNINVYAQYSPYPSTTSTSTSTSTTTTSSPSLPTSTSTAPSPSTPVCSNGILESTEQCDDGNLIDGDGCSSTCTTEGRPPLANPPPISTSTPENCTCSGDGGLMYHLCTYEPSIDSQASCHDKCCNEILLTGQVSTCDP